MIALAGITLSALVIGLAGTIHAIINLEESN